MNYKDVSEGFNIIMIITIIVIIIIMIIMSVFYRVLVEMKPLIG